MSRSLSEEMEGTYSYTTSEDYDEFFVKTRSSLDREETNYCRTGSVRGETIYQLNCNLALVVLEIII